MVWEETETEDWLQKERKKHKDMNTEADTPQLWAMHITGMDELHAARSEEEAGELVAAFNEWFQNQRRPGDFECLATVVPWPYTAEGHAESLRDREEGAGAGAAS